MRRSNTNIQSCPFDLNIIADTDILHLNVAGTDLIVVDTHEAAVDLFERRSSVYSGRLVSMLKCFELK